MQPDMASLKNLFEREPKSGRYNFKLEKFQIKFDKENKLYIEQDGEVLKLNEYISSSQSNHEASPKETQEEIVVMSPYFNQHEHS